VCSLFKGLNPAGIVELLAAAFDSVMKGFGTGGPVRSGWIIGGELKMEYLSLGCSDVSDELW